MEKYPLLLKPVSKQIIWGGDVLKKEYNKKAPFEKIAESWELSVRPGENCVIRNGGLKGRTLMGAIAGDRSFLGTNCDAYDRFPLLIKFIDAGDRLSIQVHPDNEYAMAHEGETGKTEMWYIMDADPGAQLVYGLKPGTGRKELEEAVKGGYVEEVMNYVDVKKGDVFFSPAGQVHAIGKGILIAEIQQNCNVTYRVYDYNRRQPDGSLRKLHTEKALDVIVSRTEEEIRRIRFSKPAETSGTVLGSCDYFTSVKYTVCQGRDLELQADVKSFMSLLFLESEGAFILFEDRKIRIRKGDSLFIPADMGKFRICGGCELISTTVN
ncbi:MAG: class I mannose-6-phosphate isomerase [Clostridia bacterium]|nr:class I mannose-6-phosphate isomerase [Clostridia bacterium]